MYESSQVCTSAGSAEENQTSAHGLFGSQHSQASAKREQNNHGPPPFPGRSSGSTAWKHTQRQHSYAACCAYLKNLRKKQQLFIRWPVHDSASTRRGKIHNHLTTPAGERGSCPPGAITSAQAAHNELPSAGTAPHPGPPPPPYSHAICKYSIPSSVIPQLMTYLWPFCNPSLPSHSLPNIVPLPHPSVPVSPHASCLAAPPWNSVSHSPPG